MVGYGEKHVHSCIDTERRLNKFPTAFSEVSSFVDILYISLYLIKIRKATRKVLPFYFCVISLMAL